MAAPEDAVVLTPAEGTVLVSQLRVAALFDSLGDREPGRDADPVVLLELVGRVNGSEEPATVSAILNAAGLHELLVQLAASTELLERYGITILGDRP